MADFDRAGDGLFPDFLNDYFAESDEHLQAVRGLLLTLEGSVGRDVDRRTVDELFRHFHSMKGISGMVELRPAEELAHALEGYLRALQRCEVVLTTDAVDTLFEGTQLLERVVGARRAGEAAPSIAPIAERLQQLVEGAAPRPAAKGSGARPAAPGHGGSDVPVWRFTFTPSHELVARGVRVDAVKRRIESIGDLLTATPHVLDNGAIVFEFVAATSAEASMFGPWREDGIAAERVAGRPSPDQRIGENEAHPRASESEHAPGAAARSHHVRVDLTRLDELMRHVGDLVISRARLIDALAPIERAASAADWRAVQENARVLDRQIRTLREGIMRVRLVPVAEIFRRMPFVVRDLARETGKRARVDVRGQGTEIDKFIIERMMDPVLHLVRNAVSHGIETVDERVAAGKPPEGTITLRAATAGDVVRLEVADDGRGIDRGAVVARAAEAGVLVPPGPLDDAALLALITAPGLSTRAESDRASGRGIGMAVVQAAVEDMSGSLRVETESGAGTRFVIEVPVSLAITDALIAVVGRETFAIPQGAVREVVEVPAASVHQLEQNEIVAHRGSALPVVRLSRLFGLPEPDGDRLHLFVVGNGPASAGIAADRIVGHREIVVRATADPLVKVNGIAGATDLGDGRPVLILDPAALIRQVRERPDRVPGAPERQHASIAR